jgi:DNA-binding transcriptional LysR family regulator
MDLRYLRTFVTIAEAGGITRALARLGISQPAASRQILALEAELGIKLFDRIGRRLRLTSAGEDLARQSRRLLIEAELLEARVHTLKGGETGILRVGATPMAIENALSAFLSPYRRRHPGVEVHFVEDGGLRLADRLERGDVDLALVVPNDRFRARPLFPAHSVAVMSKKHPLSRRRALDIAELSDKPLLLLNRTFGSREWFDSACNLARIRPRVLLESAAPHTLVALAGMDYGIAVVPSNVALPASVGALPLVQRGASIGRWLTVAWDPRRMLAAYAEQFVDELAAHWRLDYPGRELVRRAPPLPRPKSSAIDAKGQS